MEEKARPKVITSEDIINQAKRLSLMSRNFSTRAEETTKTYHCEKCEDSYFRMIEREGRHVAIPCDCRETQEIRKRWERSGYSEILKQKTMETYITENKARPIHWAKQMAMDYLEEFTKEDKNKGQSIIFSGTVGAGKTHLCMAIAGELMNRNIGVEYLSYRETITDLKQNVMNSVNYKKALNKYIMAPVLLIDDLFKGKISSSDINIFFEIINHRYLHQKPLIISTEHPYLQLVGIDEAIGSRIVEMCRGYVVNFDDQVLNHRLQG